MPWNGKEIFEMKLTVATDCILRCKYCFVDKSKNSRMASGTAEKALDFLLSSHGKDKIVKIYGGEPLLNFAVVEKIIPFARKIAGKNRKKLTFSLCTNAVLLKPGYIDFFKKNNFQLAISFDGRKSTHDKFRRFRSGAGTFDAIMSNFEYLFKNYNKKDLAANMSIVPSESKNILNNFKHNLEIGFDTINLEPVYGFEKWTLRNLQEFKDSMLSISRMILSGIRSGNFIFLTTVNRELKYGTLSRLKEGVCLFHQFPEIYPDGRIAFSSFFLNLPEEKQKKYIVGDINRKQPVDERYANCRFDRDSEKCRECVEAYFDIYDESLSSKIVEVRNLFSIKLANEIIKNSSRDNFKQYIKEAKKHICF